MRTCLCVLIIGLASLVAAPALGQMTSEDIAELRERGKAEGWTFIVTENEATKLPLDQLCGIRVSDQYLRMPPGHPVLPKVTLAPYFNWRDLVGDIPVRNQSSCGSCWAFAGTGVFEWAIKIRDGVIVDLAEQWLVSCNQDGWGCGGGDVNLGLDYYTWKTDPCYGTGAVWETDFPYRAVDLPCDCPYDHPYLLQSWDWIGSNISKPSVEEIKNAILTKGPVGVCVYVDNAFASYGGGVFNACSDNPGINHGVVLVGWDDNQGSNGVWFMRNSWGPGWGEGGYMRIEYDCSRIGAYATYAVYDGPVDPSLAFEYPNGIPDTIAPYEMTPFEVDVHAVFNGTAVPGSGLLHYTINGGETQSVPMADLGPGQYEAMLPMVDCTDLLEFYVSVEE